MKIRELRDYLNSLDESVLDYDVMLEDLYNVRGGWKSVELDIIEVEYKENRHTKLREPNKEDIKECGCLFLGIAKWELSSNEMVIIMPEEYEIVDEEGDVVC